MRRQRTIFGLLLWLAVSLSADSAEIRFVDQRPENAREIERYISRTETATISVDSVLDLLSYRG